MATVYWVGGGSSDAWSATGNTNWSTGSGGSNNASVPGSGDTAIFDANSGTATAALTGNTSIANLTMTNYAGTFADGGHNMTVITSAIFGSGMTLTATGIWSNSTTATTFQDNGTNKMGTFRCSTGAITLNGNFNCGNFSSQSSGYSFTTNGYTMGVLTLTLSTTGTFTAGASTINCGGNLTASAGTLNFGTSTINITAAATFAGGGNTFYNVNYTPAATGTLSITGANTFASYSTTATASIGSTTKFPAATTTTITGAITTTSPASGDCVLESGTANTQTIVSVGAASTLSGTTVKDIAFIGAGIPVNAYGGTNANLNSGDNSGIQFNANYDVIQASTVGSGTASSATSGALAITAGHMIAVIVAENQTGNTYTLSDTAGNSYVSAVTETNTNQTVEIYYAKNCLGNSANAVTVSSTGTTSDIAVVQYDVVGMDLSAPLDKTAIAATTGTAPTTASTGTLSQADEVVISAVITADTTVAHLGAGTNYFKTPYQIEVSTVYVVGSEYKTVAATTATTGAFTDTTSAVYAIAAATFKYTAPAAHKGNFLMFYT